jgi:hypothetical protein
MDFQAAGGNCAMILPAISLVNCELYNDCVRHTTVRVDLPLFAFDGFKNPLMKHIVLLYFIQPSFMNDLIINKEERVIEKLEIKNEDKTRLRISHLPEPK